MLNQQIKNLFVFIETVREKRVNEVGNTYIYAHPNDERDDEKTIKSF